MGCWGDVEHSPVCFRCPNICIQKSESVSQKYGVMFIELNLTLTCLLYISTYKYTNKGKNVHDCGQSGSIVKCLVAKVSLTQGLYACIIAPDLGGTLGGLGVKTNLTVGASILLKYYIFGTWAPISISFLYIQSLTPHLKS